MWRPIRELGIPLCKYADVTAGRLRCDGATWLSGLHNDVYFQIGFLTTLGLSTKNAILIIQFAQYRMEVDRDWLRQPLGCKNQIPASYDDLTSVLFGVLPLAIASGAGAGAQNAIG